MSDCSHGHRMTPDPNTGEDYCVKCGLSDGEIARARVDRLIGEIEERLESDPVDFEDCLHMALDALRAIRRAQG